MLLLHRPALLSFISWITVPQPETTIIDDHSRLPQRQLAQFLQHFRLTFRHLRSLISAVPESTSTIELYHVEVKISYIFQAPEYRLPNDSRPGVYIARMHDGDLEIQASNSEVLLVLETGFREALEDVVAVDGECVVRVLHTTGLEVHLTAAMKMSQTQLGLGNFLTLGALLTDPMPMLDTSNIPAYSNWICRVEVFLNLLLGRRFNADGVGKLDGVVAMYVLVVLVILEYVYHLTSADEVVDAVFNLLWQHQERRGRVVLRTLEVRLSDGT